MSRRFATLYTDGSFGVHPEGSGMDKARNLMRYDGEDVELVEVEIKMVNTFGKINLQKVTEHSALCPTCHTEVFV